MKEFRKLLVAQNVKDGRGSSAVALRRGPINMFRQTEEPLQSLRLTSRRRMRDSRVIEPASTRDGVDLRFPTGIFRPGGQILFAKLETCRRILVRVCPDATIAIAIITRTAAFCGCEMRRPKQEGQQNNADDLHAYFLHQTCLSDQTFLRRCPALPLKTLRLKTVFAICPFSR